MNNLYGKLAAIFFIILIILTFSSQTIANMLVPKVKTTFARQGKISEVVEAYSVAQKVKPEPIYATVGGKINDIYVEEGNVIKKGDIVLTYNLLKQENEISIIAAESKKILKELNNNIALKETLPDAILKNLPEFLSTISKEAEIEKLKKKIDFSIEKLDLYKKLYDAGAVSHIEIDTLLQEISFLEDDLHIAEYELAEIINENEKIEASCNEEYEKAVLELELEKQRFERVTDEIKLEYEIYQLKLENAKSELANLKAEISPFSGVVNKIYFFNGQLIFPNDHIMDIEITDEYETIFELKNTEAQSFYIGSKVNIYYEQDNRKMVEGVVAKIRNKGDLHNTKELIVKFKTDEDMRGQVVKLFHIIDSIIYDYIVPNNAVKYDGKNYYVLVVDDSEKEVIAKKVPVYILNQNDENTAIQSAYGLNTEIIIESSKKLTGNEKVYIERS